MTSQRGRPRARGCEGSKAGGRADGGRGCHRTEGVEAVHGVAGLVLGVGGRGEWGELRQAGVAGERGRGVCRVAWGHGALLV